MPPRFQCVGSGVTGLTVPLLVLRKVRPLFKRQLFESQMEKSMATTQKRHGPIIGWRARSLRWL